MKEPFELEWLGGVAERHFRRIRPGADELPWGTLDVSDCAPALIDQARATWTTMTRNEYATAINFARLLELLLIARTPVDLIGMASDFVADELRHVELCARVAMELGGGAPAEVDLAALAQPIADGSPRRRATELVVRLCCVGEGFSLPMLTGAMRAAGHPLIEAVLEVIVRDEAPHGRFGWLYLDAIADQLDDAERAHLAAAALDQLRGFAPLVRRAHAAAHAAGHDGKHLRRLGWMPAPVWAATARAAIAADVVAPLARHGIVLAAADVDAIVTDTDPR